jgi:flagellar motor switch protein FliN/FliY
MDQDSVDSLLQQVQGQAEALAAEVGAAPAGATLPVVPVGDTGSEDKPAGTVPTEADPFAGALAVPEGTIEEGGGRSMGDVKGLLAIEVPVIVQLGMRRMTVGEVMRLAVGAIVEFNKSADEDLELLVNNKPIGKGHAVMVGENFGIKISSVGPVRETIRKLGAA